MINTLCTEVVTMRKLAQLFLNALLAQYGQVWNYNVALISARLERLWQMLTDVTSMWHFSNFYTNA